MKRLLSVFSLLLLPVLAFGQSVINTQTLSTSGQVLSFTTNGMGEAYHTIVYTVATGSPTGVTATAQCSTDNGATFGVSFPNSTNAADTLKLVKSCSNLQMSIVYTGSATFTVTYIGSTRSLSLPVDTTSGYLTVPTLIITPLSTPSHTAVCTAGQFYVDTGFIYVCTASGTVKRATLSTF